MALPELKLNFEHKVLIQETDNLITFFKEGIRTLCSKCYSRELLIEPLHTSTSISNDELVKKTIAALQDRVKIHPPVFQTILSVLQDTSGAGIMADKLEKKLRDIKEAHTELWKRQQEQQLLQHEQQEQHRKRPTNISPGASFFRGAGAANTEPAFRVGGSPQVPTLKAGGQQQQFASSLGNERHTGMLGSLQDV